MTSLIRFFIILGLVGLACGQDAPASQCVSFGRPQNACSLPALTFTTGVTLNSTNCNERYLSLRFVPTPRVQWNGAQEGNNYTFIFIGTGPVLHWAVSDIQPSALRGNGEITNYHQLCGYLPPIPLIGDFVYQALIYRQTSSKPNQPIIFPQRLLFDLGRYAEQNGLCGPLAGVQARVHQAGGI